LSIDPDVLAERAPEHLGEALVASRGDALGLLLAGRFASENDVVWHGSIHTMHEPRMKASERRVAATGAHLDRLSSAPEKRAAKVIELSA